MEPGPGRENTSRAGHGPHARIMTEAAQGAASGQACCWPWTLDVQRPAGRNHYTGERDGDVHACIDFNGSRIEAITVQVAMADEATTAKAAICTSPNGTCRRCSLSPSARVYSGAISREADRTACRPEFVSPVSWKDGPPACGGHRSAPGCQRSLTPPDPSGFQPLRVGLHVPAVGPPAPPPPRRGRVPP